MNSERKRWIGVWVRFVLIGLLWLFFCGWLIGRMQAAGMEMNLLNLMPIPISGAIVFIPLYKKYVQNASSQGTPSSWNHNGNVDGKQRKQR